MARFKTIFMGSPEEVISPLSYLLEHGKAISDVVAVVSQPAKPKGRKQVLTDPAVASHAKSLGLNVLQPEKASDGDFLSALKALRPDIIITAAYGQILTDAFLAIPTRATINIHPSLLPEYRGATPVAATLLDGRTETGVSILFTVKKLDAGNIILQQGFAVPEDATTGAFTSTLFKESGPLLLQAMTLLLDGTFKGVQQDETRVTFCKKIAKDDGRMVWQSPSSQIVNRYKAYAPWPGSFTFLNGERVALQGITIAAGPTIPLKNPGDFAFDKGRKTLLVKTIDGYVAIRALQRSGSKLVDAASFWNGLKDKTLATFE